MTYLDEVAKKVGVDLDEFPPDLRNKVIAIANEIVASEFERVRDHYEAAYKTKCGSGVGISVHAEQGERRVRIFFPVTETESANRIELVFSLWVLIKGILRFEWTRLTGRPA